MKFATLADGSRDGQLVLVSRDLTQTLAVPDVAPTMLGALERWIEVAPILADRYEAKTAWAERGRPFDPTVALAPLPRAPQWLDGSAFPTHEDRILRATGRPTNIGTRPKMYQGLSSCFLSATEDVRLPSENDWIDFEGEFGAIVDDVPMGSSPDECLRHVRLLVQINDWSLRALAAEEMGTGFGQIRAKPACSVAPIAVTPDELGRGWADGRVTLTLNIWRNDEVFGTVDGQEMSFDFGQLLSHAAYSRDLPAGSIIGSGTVSNSDAASKGFGCILEKISFDTIQGGEQTKTGFLRYGERVRMRAVDLDNQGVFGEIDQKVVAS